MSRRRGTIAVAGLLAGLSLLAGEAAPVRTDPQPLLDEFPALGAVREVHWQGGTLGGDDRVPGPSTYFIRAAITVPPDELTRLADRYSTELDQELGTHGWPTRLLVRTDTGVAYLSAMSQ